MQIRRTRRDVAAGCLRRTATSGGSRGARVARCGGAAVAARPRVATTAAGTASNGAGEGRARVLGCASRARHRDIELESIVAGRAAQSRDERDQPWPEGATCEKAPSIHGSAASTCASLAANPPG
jgi:hypothetical protein